jgi:hypothetical protein
MRSAYLELLLTKNRHEAFQNRILHSRTQQLSRRNQPPHLPSKIF